MSTYFEPIRPCPTDLTWKEQNPSSYLFDRKVLTELQQAIEKAREEEEKSNGGGRTPGKSSPRR